MTILKQSPHQSFKVTQLVPSVAICEAVGGDRFNWDNGTDTEPAFIAYLGCSKDEVKGYVQTGEIPTPMPKPKLFGELAVALAWDLPSGKSNP